MNSIWDLKLQLVPSASVVKTLKRVGVMNALDWNPAHLFVDLLISVGLTKGRFLCCLQSAGVLGERKRKGAFQ